MAGVLISTSKGRFTVFHIFLSLFLLASLTPRLARRAEALPVQILDPWHLQWTGTGKPIDSNVNMGTLTVNTGSNTRLFLVAACFRTSINTGASGTMNAKLGSAYLTQLQFSLLVLKNQEHCWMGYLPESRIPPGTQTLYLSWALGLENITGMHVYTATYKNVSQDIPVNSSSKSSVTSTTVTFNGAIDYLAEGLTIYIASNGGSAPLMSPPADFTEVTNDHRTGHSSFLATTSNHAIDGSYASDTGVTFYSGGNTAAISAMVAASLTPAAGETLTVSEDTHISPVPPSPAPVQGDVDVPMLRFQLDSDNADDGQVIINSIDIEDLGSATNLTAKVYMDAAPCNVTSVPPPGSSLIGTLDAWDGSPQTLALSDSTVAFGSPQCIYIGYDIPAGQAGNTIRVKVSGIGVSGTDAGVSGRSFESSLLTVLGCAETGGAALASLPSAIRSATDVTSVATGGAGSPEVRWRNNGGAWSGWSPSGATYTPPGPEQTGMVEFEARATGPSCGYHVYDMGNPAVRVYDTTDQFASDTCFKCHAYPPIDAPGGVRDVPLGAVSGSHKQHVTRLGLACTSCHLDNGNLSDQFPMGPSHRTGIINMTSAICGESGAYYTGGTDIPQSNNPLPGACDNVCCHGGSGTSIQWGSTTPGCVSCHSLEVCSPNASIIDSSVTNRRAVSTEFGRAYGHKSSSRDAVVDSDCIVCHLEGDYSTQKTSSRHADGVIDLRDPDGTGETLIKDISGTDFSFVRYAFSNAPGSRTSTGHLSNTVTNVLTQNFCLSCHDSDGAQNPTALTEYGAPDWYMPFGGVLLGAAYTQLVNSVGTQGLIDVKSQTLPSNSSRHPVQGPNSKSYPFSSRLQTPYNFGISGRESNPSTAGGTRTRVDSVVLNCFDCHTDSIDTPQTNRTTVSHGGDQMIFGSIYVNTLIYRIPSTFCTSCHIPRGNINYGYMSNNSHAPGSAFTTGNFNIAEQTKNCYGCHFSQQSDPGRPVRAADIHGFNGMLATGGPWTYGLATDMRPVAFLRNIAWSTTSPRPNSAPNLGVTGAPNCGGNSTLCSAVTHNHAAYAPGGDY